MGLRLRVWGLGFGFRARGRRIGEEFELSHGRGGGGLQSVRLGFGMVNGTPEPMSLLGYLGGRFHSWMLDGVWVMALIASAHLTQ